MWDEKAGRHAHLASWEREVKDGVGDADSTAFLGSLLLAAGKGSAGKAGKGSAIPPSESKREQEFANMLWELRELVRTRAASFVSRRVCCAVLCRAVPCRAQSLAWQCG